jgi:hypothetical protein
MAVAVRTQDQLNSFALSIANGGDQVVGRFVEVLDLHNVKIDLEFFI